MSENLFPSMGGDRSRKLLEIARARRREQFEVRVALLKQAADAAGIPPEHTPYAGSTENFLDGFALGTVKFTGSVQQAMAAQFLAKKRGWVVSRTNLKDGRYALERTL